MLDSTARAERIDLPSSEDAFYTWEVAQKPVAVRLPLTLIDRLESEAVENFRSLSSRGSEIGGVLLGSTTPGTPVVVTVADYHLIACEYSRGPLYRLSDADLARFEQAIERYGNGSGPHVVGYFRSHTRKGLSLDAEDLAFFEPRFLDPHHMALLIRPFATKVSSAGIFIRENGRLGGDASYREFPFRSSDLVGTHGNGERSELSPSPAPVPQAAAQSAATPKPQARGQIVPIASRREIALPEPVGSAPTSAPLVAERIDALVNTTLKSQTAAAALSPVVDKHSAEKPAASPTIEKVAAEKVAAEKVAAEKIAAEKVAIEKVAAEKPAAEKLAAEKLALSPTTEKPAEKADKEKEKAAVLLAPSVEPAAEAVALALTDAELEAPAPEKKNKKLRLMVAAAVGMLVLVGGGLVVYPMLTKRVSPPPAVGQQDTSPLSLRVERTSGGMLLTWNRDLPVIQGATKVVLSISDGDRHEYIQLDPNQVRTGSILYPPISNDVSFQMEVTDPHQAKTTSESLRVLDPRPSPLDQPSATPAATQSGAKDSATPTKPATTETAATPADDTKPVAEETPVTHPAVNLKPFNSASLAQRLRPASPTDLPEAPAIVHASSPASASLPGFEPSQAPLPAPPKPVGVQTAAPPQVKVGGQLIPAKVISRVDAQYPKLAKQAGASGVVELEATIAVDGKVKNPRVIHGNTMLQKAAIDAVLQWRYQPAMLNGKPVESPVEIKLNFTTQGH
jgi:TonB family protein